MALVGGLVDKGLQVEEREALVKAIQAFIRKEERKVGKPVFPISLHAVAA